MAGLFLVDSAKQAAVEGMEMFLRNFGHVPDDKLGWVPTPTAKSAIRIAAHTALYAGRFAQMIEDRQLPIPADLPAWLAEREAEETAIDDRGTIEAIFRRGTERVLQALDKLTVEDLELTFDPGQGWTMSMKQLIRLPGWHSTLHTGQIDYLQTCWDDQRIYVE